MSLGLNYLRAAITRRRNITTGAVFAEFDESNEDWLSYTERMQQYFMANEVREDRQRATLLSTCGPATCKLIKGLGNFGETLLQRSLKELVQLVNAHKRQQSSLLCNSFNFTQGDKWKQRPLRSMLPSSRRLLTNCNVVDVLEDMLRDRLVCGLRDAALEEAIVRERPYLPTCH